MPGDKGNEGEKGDPITVTSTTAYPDYTKIVFSDGTSIDIPHGRDGENGGKGEKGEKGDPGKLGNITKKELTDLCIALTEIECCSCPNFGGAGVKSFSVVPPQILVEDYLQFNN